MNNLLTEAPIPIASHSALHGRSLVATDQPAWDALVQASPTGCFMQAWAWSAFKAREGYQVWRYGLFQGNTLVGGWLLYAYLREGGANLLLAPGGMVLPVGEEQAGLALLLDHATQLAAEVGAIALRIEPLLTEKPDYLAAFVRAPADLLPSETLLIDLRPGDADRLAAMKPKGRYNLRLSQRYGVTTEFTTDFQAIAPFYDLFWETVRRQEFFGEPYGFFINLCQTLIPAGMAEIGLVRWQGDLLAAILVVYWGDRATYLYGGRSTHHPQVMAPYHLHWTAMQRATARGCYTYDFYGYTEQADHSYARFSRFKRQFGGNIVTTIGAHDYFFYDQLADTLIHLLQSMGDLA